MNALCKDRDKNESPPKVSLKTFRGLYYYMMPPESDFHPLLIHRQCCPAITNLFHGLHSHRYVVGRCLELRHVRSYDRNHHVIFSILIGKDLVGRINTIIVHALLGIEFGFARLQRTALAITESLASTLKP